MATYTRFTKINRFTQVTRFSKIKTSTRVTKSNRPTRITRFTIITEITRFTILGDQLQDEKSLLGSSLSVANQYNIRDRQISWVEQLRSDDGGYDDGDDGYDGEDDGDGGEDDGDGEGGGGEEKTFGRRAGSMLDFNLLLLLTMRRRRIMMRSISNLRWRCWLKAKLSANTHLPKIDPRLLLSLHQPLICTHPQNNLNFAKRPKKGFAELVSMAGERGAKNWSQIWSLHSLQKAANHEGRPALKDLKLWSLLGCGVNEENIRGVIFWQGGLVRYNLSNWAVERVSVRCCKVSLVCFQKLNKNISLVCHFRTKSSADGQIV